MLSRVKAALAVLVAVIFPCSAMALEVPKGKIVLVIKGEQILRPNVGNTAQFDLEMLEALPGRKASMETPWFVGEVSFSGPFLRAVLDAAGAQGSVMRVSAINKYAAEVPLEDAAMDTILATRINDKRISVREKGPLFLIYPFDKDPALYNEKYFNRSVWQINEIEIR